MEARAKRTVLVVEDDDTLQAALEYNLTREGYEVLQATHGEAALEMARRALSGGGYSGHYAANAGWSGGVSDYSAGDDDPYTDFDGSRPGD